MIVLAMSMDVAALLILGCARFLPPGRWSRTGLIMIAVSLALLSISVWLASGS
ncbi:hypothetical protein GCM10023085_04080 [Actinomadura viridis]|uniref:Uncharacterized protein n=1 Tax=Actinomadura viridis TaxID=58110 RepID=A0A931DP75_9ACTN|nr:hypothetical protein [Actinomadura viridis]MBG6091226.1 hypothetical protein [Actinomadura viridis]